MHSQASTGSGHVDVAMQGLYCVCRMGNLFPRSADLVRATGSWHFLRSTEQLSPLQAKELLTEMSARNYPLDSARLASVAAKKTSFD